MRLSYAFNNEAVGTQTKIDYAARTDGQPVYKGYAPIEHNDDYDKWVIHYYTYDGSDNVTGIKCKRGSWSGRVALFA
jgi:hypothetical protein